MIWITTERKPCDCHAIDRLGNVYRIANGYMGYHGTPEEYTRDQKTAIMVFDLSRPGGARLHEAVNIPNGGYIQVFSGGMPLHVLSDGVLAHSQTLDVIHDVHFRRTVFSIEGGGMALVRSRRFASITQPHLLCIEYAIQVSQEGPLVVRSGIDGDVWESNGPRLENFSALCHAGVLSLTAQVQQRHVSIAVSEITLLPGGLHTCVQEEKRILQEITVQAAAYQPVIVSKFAAVYTGIDSGDPLEDGTSLCRRAAQLGFETLYRDHCAFWDKGWRENGRLGHELRKTNRTYRSLKSRNLC